MASLNATTAVDYFTVDSLTESELERLFSKIVADPDTGCWNWTASGKNGYGVLFFRGERVYVHRLMLAWSDKPLQRGCGKHIPTVDHLCRNRICCNPFHLRVVSQRENILAGDGVSARAAKQTHCKSGHPLDNVRSNGKRFCRTCERARDRKRQHTEHRKAQARAFYRRNRAACLARVKARLQRLKAQAAR